MARRAVPLVAGNYYHLYNRGHNRAPIFFRPENYTFFLQRLHQYVVGPHASLVAYALLPNHYHLLLQAQTNSLSHAMQLLGISYTKAINKRFRRSGALFQGPFQAKLVDRDAYLLHLSRYIHRNPVDAGLVRRVEDWVYSIYREYIGLRGDTSLQPEVVLSQFASHDEYREFVEDCAARELGVIAHLLLD